MSTSSLHSSRYSRAVARLALTLVLSVGTSCGGDPVGTGEPFDTLGFSFADAAGDTLNVSATATRRAADPLSGVFGNRERQFTDFAPNAGYFRLAR